jgi:hypothetical protein
MNFPYVVKIKPVVRLPELIMEMHKWCETNFGDYDVAYTGHITYPYFEADFLAFKNPEDAMLFKLTWS